MKTYAIITSVALIACLIIIFWPQSPDQETSDLLNQRDSALLQATRKQAAYDLMTITLRRKEAELLNSRAVVKRSEEKLTLAKANERRALRLVKEQTRLMSDLQADSVLKYRFRDDPDSISQKILTELAELDQCETVRHNQGHLLESYREMISQQDSAHTLLTSMAEVRSNQVSSLYEALDKDNKIIGNKDKQLKKQRKKVKILSVSIPVAFIAGLLIAL